MSRVPLIGSVRKIKQVVSRSRSLSLNSIDSEESTAATLPSSGVNTPTFTTPRMADELSMTRLDVALQQASIVRQERNEGIDWDAAILGHRILTSATQRLSCNDATISRALYIDAVKYLNRGLPQDLNESEINAIIEFLPFKCRMQGQRGQDLAVNLAKTKPRTDTQSSAQSPNMIRTSTARVITFLLALAMFALPLVASLLNRALAYEREHHLTERAVVASGQVARSAGSAGITVGDYIVKWSRSSVGVYFIVRLGWLMQSMIEGVGDGIETSLKTGRDRATVARNEMSIRRIEIDE